jgi:signal transduction histidine kinase/ActR/RegA family two-component response regulator
MSVVALQDQLRQTLGRLEAALSSVDDSLVLTDFDGRVEWTNRAFDQLVGHGRLRSLGRRLSDLLPQRYVDGKPSSSDCLLAWARQRSGRCLWDFSATLPRRVYEVKWSPVNLNPAPSLVFVFRDLSEITNAQDQITRARDTLEQEVAARTRELKQARDEALAATGAMSDFLSTISHEIRTPLNAVIGMTDLLLDTPLSVAQQELVQTIHGSGELLLRLINDILDLSKIEAKKMPIKQDSFSLRTVALDCCRMLDPAARSKGLQLECNFVGDPPDGLIGDSLRVRQIILNLINNAIKFTAEGYVRLSLDCHTLSPSRIELEIVVEDSGEGISPEFISRIFQDFTQDLRHDHSSQVHGTGLGLAICDRLCRLMGGSISVESELGSGSRFQVRLPLSLSFSGQSATATTTMPVDPALPPPRILVAEDNRINQRVLQLLLDKLHLSAEFVSDGAAAVERIREGGIDLVLMDLQMPGLDGLEATRQVRAEVSRAMAQPYIIALTAYAFEDHQEECRLAGMQDFLSKPVRLPDLQAALARYGQWRMANRDQDPTRVPLPPAPPTDPVAP